MAIYPLEIVRPLIHTERLHQPWTLTQRHHMPGVPQPMPAHGRAGALFILPVRAREVAPETADGPLVDQPANRSVALAAAAPDSITNDRWGVEQCRMSTILQYHHLSLTPSTRHNPTPISHLTALRATL